MHTRAGLVATKKRQTLRWTGDGLFVSCLLRPNTSRPANGRLRDTGRIVSQGRSVQRHCAQKPSRFIVHGGRLGVRSLCELRCPPSPGVRGRFAAGERYRDCEMPIAVRPAFPPRLSTRLRDPHAAKVLLNTDQQVCGSEGSVGSWRGASCGRQWPRAGVASHAGPRADSAGCAHSVSWFRSAVRTRSRNPRA